MFELSILVTSQSSVALRSCLRAVQAMCDLQQKQSSLNILPLLSATIPDCSACLYNTTSIHLGTDHYSINSNYDLLLSVNLIRYVTRQTERFTFEYAY